MDQLFKVSTFNIPGMDTFLTVFPTSCLIHGPTSRKKNKVCLIGSSRYERGLHQKPHWENGGDFTNKHLKL